MSYNTNRKAELISFLKENSKKALSTEQIAGAILKDGRGKSTLYRLIDELVKEEKIRRIKDKSTRHITYQYLGAPECHEHLHLKCASCGRLIHLGCELSYALVQNIKESARFSLDLGEVLFGKCEDCKG